jgi:hypothetical protein
MAGTRTRKQRDQEREHELAGLKIAAGERQHDHIEEDRPGDRPIACRQYPDQPVSRIHVSDEGAKIEADGAIEGEQPCILQGEGSGRGDIGHRCHDRDHHDHLRDACQHREYPGSAPGRVRIEVATDAVDGRCG